MTITNNKITSCTRKELIAYWSKTGYCDVMTYWEYEERMVECGVEITDEKEEQSCQTLKAEWHHTYSVKRPLRSFSL